MVKQILQNPYFFIIPLEKISADRFCYLLALTVGLKLKITVIIRLGS